MRLGSAFHLYEGAMRRGRSVRTVVACGFAGWKGSAGQERAALLEGLNVGVVYAAVLVCTGADRAPTGQGHRTAASGRVGLTVEGYSGRRYRLSVPVGKRPICSLMLAA